MNTFQEFVDFLKSQSINVILEKNTVISTSVDKLKILHLIDNQPDELFIFYNPIDFNILIRKFIEADIVDVTFKIATNCRDDTVYHKIRYIYQWCIENNIVSDLTHIDADTLLNKEIKIKFHKSWLGTHAMVELQTIAVI